MPEFRRAVDDDEEKWSVFDMRDAEEKILRLSTVSRRGRGKDPRTDAVTHVQANPSSPLPSLLCLKSWYPGKLTKLSRMCGLSHISDIAMMS